MTILCHRDDIANNSARGFDIDGDAIFVVHHQHRFYAYRNHCPHLGLELNWQPDQFLTVDGSLIQCATHGALFLIDSGECVSGSCSGQALQPVAITIDNDRLCLTAETA